MTTVVALVLGTYAALPDKGRTVMNTLAFALLLTVALPAAITASILGWLSINRYMIVRPRLTAFIEGTIYGNLLRILVLDWGIPSSAFSFFLWLTLTVLAGCAAIVVRRQGRLAVFIQGFAYSMFFWQYMLQRMDPLEAVSIPACA